MAFQRSLSANLVTSLQSTPLFREHLHDDIRKGVVFPAIRKECVDFYYKGGKLFGFDAAGLHTHAKYASVLRRPAPKGYVRERDLEKAEPIRTFAEGYGRIKELCGLYSGNERGGLAALLTAWSYAKPGLDGSTVILDVEICLRSMDPDSELDRIDLLVLHGDGAAPTLRFVEVKCFGNPELVSRSTPKVLGQIERYRAQLAGKDQRKHIVAQYRNYVSAVNGVLGLDLPLPQGLDAHVGLLVFGFDDAQKKVMLEKIAPKLAVDGKTVSLYCIGNLQKVKLDTLWHKTSNPGHATADS